MFMKDKQVLSSFSNFDSFIHDKTEQKQLFIYKLSSSTVNPIVTVLVKDGINHHVRHMVMINYERNSRSSSSTEENNAKFQKLKAALEQKIKAGQEKYKTVEDVVISLETFDKQISQIVDIDYMKVDFSILKELSPQFVGQDKCLSKNLYISNF